MAQPAQPNLFHYFHPVNARRQDAAAPDANLNPNHHPHPHPPPDILPPDHHLHPDNVNANLPPQAHPPPNHNPPPPPPPPQPQPADEPRLWSLLHWPIWDFRFNLEARLSGLWTLISSHPNQQVPLLQPPAPQNPRVIRMYTLPTGLPDKERIFNEVNLGRNERAKYVAARARYEDQVREHEFLRGWVRRTVAGDILEACCDEGADVREWYVRIKAYVEGWKREADAATRQKRSRLAGKRKRKGQRQAAAQAQATAQAAIDGRALAADAYNATAKLASVRAARKQDPVLRAAAGKTRQQAGQENQRPARGERQRTVKSEEVEEILRLGFPGQGLDVGGLEVL